MLLTLPAPTKTEFDFKHPHDFPPSLPAPSSVTRPSPERTGDSHRSLPASASHNMSGPHRGLPPPAAMQLPEPNRPPQPPVSQSLGQMPAAPPQWQGGEEPMRNWLYAKAEEEKRRQEEERTRQESLRLEQRKIEQAMLQDSMRGGIPPQLVPVIFAGIGGANLANFSLELFQQYAAQIQAAQQVQQQQVQQQQQPPPPQQQQQLIPQSQHSPDRNRTAGLISQPPPAYGVPPQQASQAALPSAPILQGQQLPSTQHQTTFSAYQPPMSPSSRARMAQPAGPGAAPASAARAPIQSTLPRLTTNEMQIQHPPSGPVGPHAQTTQVVQQEQTTSSPSIYFHHWVPPSQADKKKEDTNPGTPASVKRQEPQSHYPTGHVTEPDYTSSPKRRKTQTAGSQPSGMGSQPIQHTSPSFSQASSGTSTPGRRPGHSRTRSDVSSTRGGFDPAGRPLSRHGHGGPLPHEGGPHADPSLEPHRSHQPSHRGAEERSDSGTHHPPSSHHETRHS